MSHVNPPLEDWYSELESQPGETRLWRDTYTGKDLNAFDMHMRLASKPLAPVWRILRLQAAVQFVAGQ